MKSANRSMTTHFYRLALSLLLSIAVVATPASAQSVFRDTAPDRYVVKKGDTLWGIAKRLLNNPAKWRQVWKVNPSITNPHLIFPGDLLVLQGRHGGNSGIKVVRLKPKIRATPRDDAIPTIPPALLQPFLNASLVVDKEQLQEAGYVVVGTNEEIILGKNQQFYARNIKDQNAAGYSIFNIGRELVHPVTKEPLGSEGIHLGDAVMVEPGDVAKMHIISSEQEIRPRDRVIASNLNTLVPYYQPHVPDTALEGWLLHAPNGVQEIGKLDTAIISLGKRDGLEEGHIFTSLRHIKHYKDPVTGEDLQLPDEEAGTMMVFRVFEKVAYVIVLESKRAINIGDRIVSAIN